MKTATLALICAGLFLAAPLAEAAQYVYPLRGQDIAKQANDEADCSTLARQQSGFDPSQTASAPFQVFAPTGTPSDTSTVTTAYGAAGNGQAGGPAGALGGAPGQVGTTVTAMTGSVGPSLGVVDELTGAPAPDETALQPEVRRPQTSSPGQADYDSERAACLSGRGYSVR